MYIDIGHVIFLDPHMMNLLKLFFFSIQHPKEPWSMTVLERAAGIWDDLHQNSRDLLMFIMFIPPLNKVNHRL